MSNRDPGDGYATKLREGVQATSLVRTAPRIPISPGDCGHFGHVNKTTVSEPQAPA